jgi:hypothetical protein
VDALDPRLDLEQQRLGRLVPARLEAPPGDRPAGACRKDRVDHFERLHHDLGRGAVPAPEPPDRALVVVGHARHVGRAHRAAGRGHAEPGDLARVALHPDRRAGGQAVAVLGHEVGRDVLVEALVELLPWLRLDGHEDRDDQALGVHRATLRATPVGRQRGGHCHFESLNS